MFVDRRVIACVLWNACRGGRPLAGAIHFSCVVGLKIKFEQMIGALTLCLCSAPSAGAGEEGCVQRVFVSRVCGTVETVPSIIPVIVGDPGH